MTELPNPITEWVKTTIHGEVLVALGDEKEIFISFTSNDQGDDISFFDGVINIKDIVNPKEAISGIRDAIETVLEQSTMNSDPLLDIQYKIRDRLRAEGFTVESQDIDHWGRENGEA